jgi:hypothetical protein
MGCRKDCHSHLLVFYCQRPQQRNNNDQREDQNSSNTSEYSQKTLCHSCIKNQVQTEVFSEANVFNGIYKAHFEDEEYQVENTTEYATCKHGKVVACMRVEHELQ